jgi:spore germination protein KB
MIGGLTMRQQENISLWQLFILILLTTLGSSIVVNIGAEAGNNAWISILIACFSGLLFLFIYFRLHKWFPRKHLFEIIDICFGKVLGRLISLGYITYFFLIASFVIRDFGELMVSSIFEETPIEFIHITMMLVILYIVMLGLEVLGRASEIFIPYALLFILFLGFGIAFSGELKLNRLLPILGDGLKPVLKPAFLEIIQFPFGEFVVFMVVIPFVSKLKYAYRTGTAAYIFSGLVLAYSSLLQTVTLGVLKDRTNFPLLSVARNISLLEFIERVDLLIVFIMMLGIVVKASVFFYGGLKGLEFIFHKPYRSFGFPMAMIIAYFSISVGDNYPAYIEIGIKVLPTYLQTLFHVGIPILLLTIAYMKKKWGSVKSYESV